MWNFGAGGLTAYVFTVHEPVLLLAMSMGLVGALLFFFLGRSRRISAPVRSSLVAFFGVTLVFYATFTWLAGQRTVTVERIRVSGSAEL